jgi:hypothetical protein
MAATIEEDVYLDDNDIKKGDDDRGESYVLPIFMPATRDIMWWFPRRPEAAGAATEARAFRETFDTPLHNVGRVWFLLDQEELQPPNGRPKHLLWALHILKVYPLQAPGCAAVGASGGAVDPKTHRKWVWAYIEAIAELVDKVVGFAFFNYNMTIF